VAAAAVVQATAVAMETMGDTDGEAKPLICRPGFESPAGVGPNLGPELS